MHLEHVNLTVKDVEASGRFYAGLLGLEVRWRGHVGEGVPALHVGDETSYLALFQAVADGSVPYDYGRPGVNHFGFVVDDLDATLARVEDLGGESTGVQSYEPGRRGYVFDPDGHEVELVEY